jgi:ribosome-associated protein
VDLILITTDISIDEALLEETFIRSPGPGGQNVNKVSTGVMLRFDLARCNTLPVAVRARLVALAKNRINSEGILVIEAHTYRTQERNRSEARERLVDLIRRAAAPPPPPRRPTRPTKASRARRLDGKKLRSDTKRSRGRPQED